MQEGASDSGPRPSITCLLEEQFLVELYLPGDGRERLADTVERARRAADEISREGTPVRHVRTIILPGEETCFCLYSSASAAAVEAASRRMQLPFERVVPAISLDEERLSEALARTQPR
jgi:Nickel responsive protein SCO4226-like